MFYRLRLTRMKNITESNPSSIIYGTRKNYHPKKKDCFIYWRICWKITEKKAVGEIPPFTPRELLASLIKENGLKQADLADIFGTQSVVSEVLAGKREITKLQAKALAEKFAIKVEAFI